MNYDVIIIGGGQSGLAVAYHLRRTGLKYLVLDAEPAPGGAWQNYWESLKLFSPAQWSSLPGAIMPGGTEHYPSQQEVVDYLGCYELKFGLKVKRPVKVLSITYDNTYHLETEQGIYHSKTIVGATGSFRNSWVPDIPGIDRFKGEIIHSSQYKTPEPFVGNKVAIIGEGNSGAQILSEVSKVATTYWITQNKPDFLPDHVDGRYLFNAATQLYEAKRKGKKHIPPSLGEIVMVDAVKEARARGVLNHQSSLVAISETEIILSDNKQLAIDAIIFCTGFRADLKFLERLPVTIKHQKIPTYGTHSRELPGLWMVGYGSWTGFASATLIGVGRSAKTTVDEIVEFLK